MHNTIAHGSPRILPTGGGAHPASGRRQEEGRRGGGERGRSRGTTQETQQGRGGAAQADRRTAAGQ